MTVTWKSEARLNEVEAEMRWRVLGEGSLLPELIMKQVDAGGKRVRPTLALRAVEACGLEISTKSIRAGAAVEMVHVGSLIHDDIMDSAETRRGVSTINSSHGNQFALVAGDLVLGVAGECAISVSAPVGSAIARSLIDLAVGQQLETESLFQSGRSEQSYYSSIRGKTGALLATSASIGGLAEGLEPAIVAALATYGMEFGLAFQIIDDLFDIVSSEGLFSKPVHNDFCVGVVNFPTLLAWQSGALTEFIGAFEDTQLSNDVRRNVSDALAGALINSEYPGKAEERARSHAVAAGAAIANVDGVSEKIADLAAYPVRYIEEQLRRLDTRRVG
jgi:heptaprenyl diphosphate synthase